MEEPKNPDNCNVYKIYSLLASTEEIKNMRKNYEGGNYGYGHAKQALFELIQTTFSSERKRYNELISDKKVIDKFLLEGAEKAREIAKNTLGRVRVKLGY